MTDSKTAKKIEVVPCGLWEERFHIQINERGDQLMNDDHSFCGTEAEAQEKAQQLANEEANKRQDELNAHFALTPAAQPTETRPPRYDAEEHRRILQSPLYAQLSEWRYIFDFLHDQQITPKKAIEALAELSIGLKPSLPARAAAPVEPPPKLSCTCASKGGYDPDCPVYAGKIPDPQAATELVEPAPRPQDWKRGEVGEIWPKMSHGCFSGLGATGDSCIRGTKNCIVVHCEGCVLCAAASSPVARPQISKENNMECTHNKLVRDEKTDDAPQIYSCPSCGEMFTTKVYEIGVQYGAPMHKRD